MFNGKRYKIGEEEFESEVIVVQSSTHNSTLSEERSDDLLSTSSSTSTSLVTITLATYKSLSKLYKVIYFLPFLKTLITSIITEYNKI